ncbi:MAG: biotin--[acetyl-CoA-carboxylase] ligase [Actinomycetota bacterium]
MSVSEEFADRFRGALSAVCSLVVVRNQTVSTNDDARELAQADAPHLSVVVAREQTAGRGRLARAWVSEPGEGLTISWVLRPTLPLESWPLIPLIAGVAVARAVRAETGVQVVLKWPNDVLVENRKLGGILAEAALPDFVVVGLGLNLAQAEFPEDLRQTATSLTMQGVNDVDGASLAAAISRHLESALVSPGRALDDYRALCTTVGRRVRVDRAGVEPIEGRAVEVNGKGALVVQTDVETVAVTAGDVTHVRDSLAAGEPDW